MHKVKENANRLGIQREEHHQRKPIKTAMTTSACNCCPSVELLEIDPSFLKENCCTHVAHLNTHHLLPKRDWLTVACFFLLKGGSHCSS